MTTPCLPESPGPMGARSLDSLLAMSPSQLFDTDIASNLGTRYHFILDKLSDCPTVGSWLALLA